MQVTTKPSADTRTPDGRPYGRPPGHRPRYPAWSVRFPDAATLVFAQIGVQAPTAAAAAGVAGVLRERVEAADGLRHLDRGRFVDAAGLPNEVLMAYWDDPERHARWAARTDLWTGLDEPDAGLWRETATIPAERIETLHSGAHRDNGTSHFLPLEPTDEHDYWGAVRDRIPRSRVDDLAGPCLIRTAQDWTRCTGEQRALYLERVEPTLRHGAEFLRDHPDETGCLAARHVRETTLDGEPLDKSCVLAWFASLGDLERWTLAHETHIAIYDAFLELASMAGPDLQLALWHEVSATEDEAVAGEYVRCHPRTGLRADQERA